MKKTRIIALAALLSLLPMTDALACSSCGCTLSPEWITEGYMAHPGWQLDFRYDFIPQGQLREGRHAVSKGSFPLPNAEEIQQDTRTSFYTLGADYTSEKDWGLRIDVPVLDRYHTTIAPGDTTESVSDRTGLGDVKVVGRFFGFGDRMTGVQAGLKLPTGPFHQNFEAGPQAGAALDRGLQLGTGTTDAIAGVYNLGYLGKKWSRFEQVLVKAPLNSREDFKPGTMVNVNAGVQYAWSPKVTPQFQFNAKLEGRDSGAQADRASSGSTVLYASPGATFALRPDTRAYGFVQLPVYQDYNGLQLAPRATLSLGLVRRF
jgi:hypothetical protein